MEEAELAAHASTWIPSEPMNQDMDAQLRYLLVMLTSGPALQIIRQQPSGVQAFRDLARSYTPRSQGSVFERLVGEYETLSGEAPGVQDKCAVLLE